MDKTIGFIGCGNMGQAMVEGIMKSKLVDGDHMIVANAHPEKLQELGSTYDFYISDNDSVARNADILVLAIKPYMYKEIIDEIQAVVKEDVIIINIAAGIEIADIYSLFHRKLKVVKAIPNTPALVLEAMSALSFGDLLDEDDREDITEIFESFGTTCEIDESLMDAATAVSGSAPAYAFMFLEALGDGAVLQGMPRNIAYQFAAQTLLGSAKMLLETRKHPGELKDMVCSPGGTTIEAVAALEAGGFRSSVLEAMRACASKSKAMNNKK